MDARQCDPKVARTALRAYVMAMSKSDRRAHYFAHKRDGAERAFTVPIYDSGMSEALRHSEISYSSWDFLALAGDLLEA